MSGGTRIMTGSVTGTGSAINVRTIGFRPKTVKLINTGGLVKAEWISPMPDAAAFKTLNHDTAQGAYITSDGITPLSNGFTIGADSDINASGEAIFYVAEE